MLHNLIIAIYTHFRCKLPDFDNGSSKYDAIRESDLRSVYLEPKDEDGSDAYCTYCPDRVQLLLNNNFSSKTNCSDDMVTAKCGEFIYDHSEWSQTVTTEFDTVCENAWKMDLVKSLFMVGLMLSVPIGGLISDKYRKRIQLIPSLGVNSSLRY